MAAGPTSIEPTLDYTTALGGRDYDSNQTYDDIGGIYDSCDDYNYDSDPAETTFDLTASFSPPFCRR